MELEFSTPTPFAHLAYCRFTNESNRYGKIFLGSLNIGSVWKNGKGFARELRQQILATAVLVIDRGLATSQMEAPTQFLSAMPLQTLNDLAGWITFQRQKQ